MNLSVEQLSDIDFFFYHGSNKLEDEIQHELMLGLIQPKRTLLYNMKEGVGISEYENYPTGITLQVGLRFDIASWVSERNTYVSNGQDGFPDRRVATSQNQIKIEKGNKGEVNIEVLFIPFYNYNEANILKIPTGIGVPK